MSYSGIGGQAVMEGVMMRNGRNYAVAVRLTDGTINVDKKKMKNDGATINKIPIVRGIYSFVNSLVVGLGSLMSSASYFEDEDEVKPQTKEEEKKAERREKLEMGGTLLFSIVLALLLFMVLPFYGSKLFGYVISSDRILAVIEGILRVIVFLVYILLIGKTEDIHRVFMYHGAEHKCINCIEHGLELTVENVRKSSRFHKRCGTSFIFIVLIISIFVFMFIQSDSRLIQLVLRIVFVPLIAGVSYEFIRLAGRSENACVNLLSKPGLLLQRLTTAEPEDEMIEVGIKSVEAVFDWKSFLSKENS
ncbi:MAG: DUF1385 domain-containing protein [Lachnospiraceae bacterium]|nr:DUF1385 domain-containing protein [Lachnospiraceae bacterium]